MRLTIREQPVIKSTVYAVICLILMLFSYSFLPATRFTDHLPNLLIAVISSLALFEGVVYSCFFALFFSVLETLILGTNTLLFPLFYVVFAMLCTWLFENVFVKNFFSWFCYTMGGLAIHGLISLFAPVSNWGISLSDVFFYTTVGTFTVSACLSILIYPLFKLLKRKTDRTQK